MRVTDRIESIAAVFFPDGTRPDGPASLSRGDRFTVAKTLIQAFYAVLFFIALGSLYSWSAWFEVTEMTLRWPVFWLRFTRIDVGVGLILWAYLLGSLLGLAFCRFRWARIVVFVTLLEFLAFKFSFGSINHGDHLGVLLAFVLILLPRGCCVW